MTLEISPQPVPGTESRNHDFHGPWDMTDELEQHLHAIFVQLSFEF